jgi:hypothetical protein
MRCVIACILIVVIPVPASAHEKQAAHEMAAAARSLVASFEEKQKAKGLFTVEDDHRHDWHFVPKERKGISLKEMTPQQRHLTTALLASSLSSQGMVKTSNIVALEQVLQTIEGANSRFIRDPELYYVSIFGNPAPGETWGWRIEGHHLALSFTVVDGQHVSSTPSMMGANPAIVPDGPHKGLQVLADEENIARELAKSLSSKQKSAAIISDIAPADIITGNHREISPLEPAGIRWADFDPDQQTIAWKLVILYVQRARGEIAEVDLAKIVEAGKENIHFAWAGGLERGQGHYYRIQGPTFLIEYDNTQHNANHIHCVYRDFKEDFGEDLLKAHYEQSHRAGANSP